LGTKPQVGYLLRMNGQLTTIEEANKEEFSKFLITKEEEGIKYPENIKIYLNICYSAKVLKPLTKAGTICSKIEV